MATHHRVHAVQTSRKPFIWGALAGFVAVVLGVFCWLASPGIKVTASSHGLIHLSLSGLNPELTSATYRASTESLPLHWQDGRLLPEGTIPAGQHGVVHIGVQGPAWLRWLPWEKDSLNRAVTVPPWPRLNQTTVSRPLGPRLTVAFNRPVSVVNYRVPGGSVRRIHLSVPNRVVRLSVSPASPGEHGLVVISAQAHSWETASPLTSLAWQSVPYVTAHISGSSSVSPSGPLTVVFSQPIAHPHLSSWVLSPSVTGQWHQVNDETYRFDPSDPGGLGPGAQVTLTIPQGTTGPQSVGGSDLSHPVTLTWNTPPGSVLRLQELLAEEGYLPIQFVASDPLANRSWASEEATIYHPLTGQFTFKYPNLPQSLHDLWVPGQMTVMIQGAIMQFERVNGLPVDGVAGPNVWRQLISDRLAGRVSPYPYTYIWVTETETETLELWVNNQRVLTTPCNTGIPVTPTYLGTSPIYERLPFQVMQGTNPNGTPYADPVHWINYFHGGDAVHGFVRAAYGFPQSLGCVEVPVSIAPTIYHTVHYGTLVTVNPVGTPLAPAS